jgi:NAD-dependent dihydropyrimidine dehydrogenase PreA subunit
MPAQSGPCRILSYDAELCVGCNQCVNVCPNDVAIPNPGPGKEPIIVFAEECWFCGGCVEECPQGAITLVAPAKQRISTIWKRKETGEEFRVGMKDPPPPNRMPPAGNK